VALHHAARADGVALARNERHGLEFVDRFGGPAVFAATWISLKLLPALPGHCSVGAASAFAGFFVRESLRGGWDVARRALLPKLALSPAVVCFPLHLPSPSPPDAPIGWDEWLRILAAGATAVVLIEAQKAMLS
jgi:hypothetical protein